MSRVEHADGDRRGPFPRDWGTPPGESDSEARAVWVLARTRQMVMLRKATPEERRARLARRRRTP